VKIKKPKIKKKLLRKILIGGAVVFLVVILPLWYVGCLQVFYTAVEYPPPVWQSNLTKKISDKQTGAIHVPILIYHHIIKAPLLAGGGSFLYVRPEIFAEQMKYLQDNGYHVIPYADFYAALTDGAPLAPKSVVLTFDDGHRDQYKNALPILKQYHYSAMFYVSTQAIGNYRGSMTWKMLHELMSSGMEIGGHTVAHKPLTSLTPEAVDYELAKSKQVLEDNLFVPINHFAYPYGWYNTSTVEAVANVGYWSATLADGGGWYDRQKSVFLIPRIIMTENMKYFKWALEN